MIKSFSFSGIHQPQAQQDMSLIVIILRQVYYLLTCPCGVIGLLLSTEINEK